MQVQLKCSSSVQTTHFKCIKQVISCCILNSCSCIIKMIIFGQILINEKKVKTPSWGTYLWCGKQTNIFKCQNISSLIRNSRQIVANKYYQTHLLTYTHTHTHTNTHTHTSVSTRIHILYWYYDSPWAF